MSDACSTHLYCPKVRHTSSTRRCCSHDHRVQGQLWLPQQLLSLPHHLRGTDVSNIGACIPGCEESRPGHPADDPGAAQPALGEVRWATHRAARGLGGCQAGGDEEDTPAQVQSREAPGDGCATTCNRLQAALRGEQLGRRLLGSYLGAQEKTRISKLGWRSRWASSERT